MKAVAKCRIRGLGPLQNVRDPPEIGLFGVAVTSGGDEKAARRRGLLFVGEFEREAPGPAQIAGGPESTQCVGEIIHVGVKGKHGCLFFLCTKRAQIIVNAVRFRGCGRIRRVKKS